MFLVIQTTLPNYVQSKKAVSLEPYRELTACTCKVFASLTLLAVKYEAKFCIYNYVKCFHKHSVRLTEKLHQQ